MNKGHYTAWIKLGNEWISCNDTIIQKKKRNQWSRYLFNGLLKQRSQIIKKTIFDLSGKLAI